MSTEETEREGFYEKMWKDFVSLQRGDAKQICVEAARYRWLKENRNVMLLTSFFGNGCFNRTLDEVDAAIDAAMTANVKFSEDGKRSLTDSAGT